MPKYTERKFNNFNIGEVNTIQSKFVKVRFY